MNDLLFDILYSVYDFFGLELCVTYDWSATAQTCITVSFRCTVWCNASSAAQKLWPPEIYQTLRNQIKSVKARK